MRQSILIIISNFKLKCKIVKMMISNNLYFYEAGTSNEAIIKQIYLGTKLNLVIFEYEEAHEAESLSMIEELRKNDKTVKIIMIIPEYKVRLIDIAAKYNIDDLLIIPFDDEELIRKIVSVTPKIDKIMIDAQAGNYEMVREEIRRSRIGGYPLSFVLINIFDLSDIESKEFEQKIAVVSKATDSLLYWEGSMYMMLYPFCKKSDLEVVKEKILQAYEESAKKLHTVRDIFIYGVSFPDDGNSFDEIITNLQNGLDNEKSSIPSKDCHNAYSRQQILSLISKLIRLDNK